MAAKRACVRRLRKTLRTPRRALESRPGVERSMLASSPKKWQLAISRVGLPSHVDGRRAAREAHGPCPSSSSKRLVLTVPAFALKRDVHAPYSEEWSGRRRRRARQTRHCSCRTRWSTNCAYRSTKMTTSETKAYRSPPVPGCRAVPMTSRAASRFSTPIPPLVHMSASRDVVVLNGPSAGIGRTLA